MIKIYKNFFDSDCLKYIEESIQKRKNTSNLRTSYYNWHQNIIHESTPVMVYDLKDADILLKPLKEVIHFEKKVHFMIYHWPVGSYIPWHNDGHASFTATLYCNKYWDENWGGLFLYKEKDKIFAEVPEWNKLVVQTDKDLHSTTSVVRPYYYPTLAHQQATPIIRTTIQIFTEL